MPRKRKDKSNWDLDPQKSSAAQFLTYIASAGADGEKYEIRYEDENIWMSQKMLASVYGVEVPNIAYHMRKLFADAELDREAVIKEILTTAADGKAYSVKHYNLDVIIALGFKIENERAVQFRKWARHIVGEYTIKGWVMDDQRLKDGSPITDKYFEHLLEKIREIRLSERKFYQKITDLYATAVDYDKTRNYWKWLKAKLRRESSQLVSATTQLKLVAPDGKRRLSDVMDSDGIVALAKKIPNERAAAFLDWFLYSDTTIDGQSKKKAYTLF